MFWKMRSTARERRLEKQVAELREQLADLMAELQAEHRRSLVKDAELQSLALVVARDRARIESETAAYARKQAEAEGVKK